MTWSKYAAILLTCCMTVVASGCSEQPEVKAEQVERQGMMKWITTDKAAYHPGEKVKFTLQLNPSESEAKVFVQYRHLGQKIGQQTVKISGTEAEWEWTPPKDDFRGYMAEVFVKTKDKVMDHLNIAVDVSSDWAKFPRYGYLADFPKLSESQMTRVIDRLNRYHINGIQFYDWQYKHHDPIKTAHGTPAAEWPDIANRPTSYDTVKGYIDLAHRHNMKAMNYNLIFGAYEDAEKDGVKKEWALYKDQALTIQDSHPLPDSWASDIMLYDPSNPEWQNYLIAKEKEVFKHLPFDGWHVDQLGERGTLWNAAGESVELPHGYLSFLKAAKKQLDVSYVMNAVNQYGQVFMALAPLDFFYTEVWSDFPEYGDLKRVIDQNNGFSSNKRNTVLAAYVNYELSNAPGIFNAPGVLLANAVIFASGGAHLELGENMLSKEYFPHKNLTLTPKLEEQLTNYYDFLTAYQNILRDELQPSDLTVVSTGGPALTADAAQGKIWSFAKKKDSSDIVHFINFADANTMNWNDTEGKQVEPKELQELSISFSRDRKVSSILFASPDYYNGSPVQLEFTQQDNQVSLKLPKLKYWDLIMVNYENASG
ncbi:glycoside hydrolase family 66 protein [Paenibacillus sp. KQZ6P-2]|uniref:Glycoside hydrolase family 66 protein n=1 Tax=Paenibacillus mangrovi TaxID=2931978 RepID=A0A9X1WPH0_9BACL|nr:glycoside hydrolase family 66 protein [Paenibacillus mangrovi]MCJ8010850.1 glycoside hydrolase family 66 protein [Paenibacillus mangrovi]